MDYLSVLAIFKNETMNLKLWLEHCLWQGVDHFYLIDNDSTDQPLDILQEYIDKGVVSYFFKPERHQQLVHYRSVFDSEDLKSKTHWLAICDLDEFYYGSVLELSVVLKLLESYDIIYSNWLMFGHDNLKEHPKDIRVAITHREPKLHVLTKYIFKPTAITSSSQITLHEIRANKVDFEKTIIENDLIRLNHYSIQSLEYFTKVKMFRGDAINAKDDDIRDMNYFERYNENATYSDETLKNLVLTKLSD